MENICMYAIPNCSKVKAARESLAQHHVAYTFIDYKKTPPTIDSLTQFASAFGWDALINKQGTTWRGLSSEVQALANDATGIAQLLLQWPSAIRRPILVQNNTPIILGFDLDAYQHHFS